MKKVIFMALATVFMLSSGFETASTTNSNVQEDPNCYWATLTTIKGPDGRSRTITSFHSAYALSAESCNNMAGRSAINMQSNVSGSVATVYYSSN